MKAAIYARVSSAKQRDAHTIESQLRILPEYVRQQGWTLVGTYVDDGRSAKAGQLDARDAFARLLADVAAGKLDVVVVVAIDRLTRSEDQTERGAILGAFQRAGVRIAVAGAGLQDLATFAGDAYVTLQALFAAEENRKRRERTVAGKLTAIARGRKPSGPTPYGFRYSKETGWSLDPEAAPLIREMFERSAGGETCEAIADDLDRRGVPRPRAGRWNRERVWQIVTARTYLGEWTADKARGLTMPVPPIVDNDLWRTVQARLEEHGKRGLDRTKHVYLLGGLAVCELCRARVGIASAVKASRTRVASPSRYVCCYRRRPPLDQSPCALPVHRTQPVDEQVWEEIAATLGRADLVAETLRRRHRAGENTDLWRRDLAAAQAHAERLDRAEAAMLARFRRGAISETAMDRELAELGREREAARRQVEAAEAAIARSGLAVAQVDALEERLAALRPRLLAAPPEMRRAIARAFLQPGDAVLGRDTVRIVLRLNAPDRSVGQCDSASTSSVAPGLVTRVALRLVRAA